MSCGDASASVAVYVVIDVPTAVSSATFTLSSAAKLGAASLLAMTLMLTVAVDVVEESVTSIRSWNAVFPAS